MTSIGPSRVIICVSCVSGEVVFIEAERGLQVKVSERDSSIKCGRFSANAAGGLKPIRTYLKPENAGVKTAMVTAKAAAAKNKPMNF